MQELDPDAYNLLCRMSCYRYQDVPTVPIEGLFCLLWDVAENRHRRVIKSLQDRSLIDYEDREFWLHPVIKVEAISRLRVVEEWRIANIKAAEFWTEHIKTIKTAENALSAFEAFHHYLEIQNFDLAAEVILKERDNIWEEGEPLSSSFYRLGIYQKILCSIKQIINRISSVYYFSHFYNLLGHPYSETESPQTFINYHLKSEEFATIYINQNLIAKDQKDLNSRLLQMKKLKIYAPFNIGLCKFYLGEIEESIVFLKRLISY